MLLTFIELFREVKMNSWKILSSQRPKVTAACLNHCADTELHIAPKLPFHLSNLLKNQPPLTTLGQKNECVERSIGEKKMEDRTKSDIHKDYRLRAWWLC